MSCEKCRTMGRTILYCETETSGRLWRILLANAGGTVHLIKNGSGCTVVVPFNFLFDYSQAYSYFYKSIVFVVFSHFDFTNHFSICSSRNHLSFIIFGQKSGSENRKKNWQCDFGELHYYINPANSRPRSGKSRRFVVYTQHWSFSS